MFRPGGGIWVYDPKHPEAAAREIFPSETGVVFDMSVSYDAQKLLFSWMDLSEQGKDSFHPYEIGIDGSGLRQITAGRWPVLGLEIGRSDLPMEDPKLEEPETVDQEIGWWH